MNWKVTCGMRLLVRASPLRHYCCNSLHGEVRHGTWYVVPVCYPSCWDTTFFFSLFAEFRTFWRGSAPKIKEIRAFVVEAPQKSQVCCSMVNSFLLSSVAMSGYDSLPPSPLVKRRKRVFQMEGPKVRMFCSQPAIVEVSGMLLNWITIERIFSGWSWLSQAERGSLDSRLSNCQSYVHLLTLQS